LGNHVQQKGSWVGPDCLRFDFLHYEKLTLTQIQAVEQIVNQKIRETVTVQEERNMSLEAAKALGATALFGEKYGSHVRLVTVDHDFSRELCGGTHVLNTGQVGFFKIVSQASVSAATRRIEAVTNEEVEKFINAQLTKLHQISEILRRPQDPIKSLQNLVEQKSDLEKKLHHYQSQTVQDMVRRMVDTLQSINGISVVIDEVKVPDAVVLKQVALQLVSHTTPLFITLVAVIDTKPFITVAIADTLVERLSLQAHAILKELAIHIQGEGGGQAFFAMAQGKDAGGIQKVLKRARQLVEKTG
jgi:alanyl-tRNA synthetase